MDEKIIEIPDNISEVLQRRVHGMSFEYIAKELGITKDAVRKRVHRFAIKVGLSCGKDLIPYLCYLEGRKSMENNH